MFVTGGTGFLGLEVLSQLVSRTSSRKIYCLVRTKSPSHDPKTRLCDVLRSRKCFTKDMESATFRSTHRRSSDLTLPRFGLENFESIARTYPCDSLWFFRESYLQLLEFEGSKCGWYDDGH